MASRQDTRYGIWLAACVGSRPGAYSAVISEFGSARGAYNADLSKAKPSGALSRKIIAALADKDLSEASRIADFCSLNRIAVLFPSDEEYPALLRDLPDLPAVLYVKGRLPDFSRIPAVSVVGTRKMTEYGMLMAYSMGYGLARGGAAVISGMAAGGDSMSHCGALDAGGYTVAVLGCGVDRAYPTGNARLMQVIAERGAVISEYPPGTEVRRQNFPERNRIISGLSRAVIVTEADAHSGALITARRARLQARAVFAVPGKVGEKGSAGVNSLLKDGAETATNADDVLKDFLFLYPDAVSVNASEMRSAEQAELSAISYGIDMGDYARERRKRTEEEKRSIPVPEIRIREAEKDIYISEKKEETAVTEAELALIDERTRAIFMSLPDTAFLPDEAAGAEFDCVDIMCALTLLEVNGLVRAVPGGRYKAKRRNI